MKKIKGILAFSTVMLGALLLLFSNCKKDEEEQEAFIPAFSVLKISRITDNSVAFCGCVKEDGGAAVTAKGICFSTSSLPTIEGSCSPHGVDTGSIACCLNCLFPDTKYYARVYATNSSGTYYGDEVSFTTPPTMTDADGNTYHTVRIGDQVWMAENLKTTHYRNGDPIPNLTNSNEWLNSVSGAYCEYNNNHEFGKVYGMLYNYYALVEERNIAPAGWHVPSDDEWKTLEGTVDSRYKEGDSQWDLMGERGFDVGGKLKSTSTLWTAPNSGATDEYGFSALPGGVRDPFSGDFKSVGLGGFFGSKTIYGGSQMWYRDFWYALSNSERLTGLKNAGGSVRLIQDKD